MAENAYIRFAELPHPGRKTKVWEILSRTNDAPLGLVEFLPAWRKYVFSPGPATIFDTFCLGVIAEFLEKQTKEWRRSLA